MNQKKTRQGFYRDRSATITQEILKSVVDYNPETGLFSRKTTWHRYKAGSAAGCLNPNGYVYLSVNGTRTFAHRFAWLYMTGGFPDCDIDHINGSKSDNRWSNLREARGSLNSENQRHAHRNNKAGLLGVRKNNRGGWSARIRVNGKLIQIGSFQDPETAHKAYIDAKRELHNGCTL